MAFDKNKAPHTSGRDHDQDDSKKMKKKKPFTEGSHTDKGKHLDSYDKEQKNDKELAEKKPGKN